MKLTEYSHAAGCGCKMAPADLEKLLEGNTAVPFKELLVGNSSHDDAAVWDLGNGQALVSTVDFFMPIVDNAYDFGRIAAANALSDVYAMGGSPIFANALLGWPIGVLPIEMASQVMEGAKEICKQANIPIAGGHSIDSKEPLFGLAVNGLVRTKHIKRNNTPKEGDMLFLTKPLGTGIMGTAIRRNLAKEPHTAQTIESMCRLNLLGKALAEESAVTGMTDVTGFGLFGHLIEMCGESLSVNVFSSKVPVFDFIDEYLAQNIIPDNTYRNWNAWEKKVTGTIGMREFQLFNDPQTSGGLLLACNKTELDKVVTLFESNGLSAFVEPIGEFTGRSTHTIMVA